MVQCTHLGSNIGAAPSQAYVQQARVPEGADESGVPAVADMAYNSVARWALPEGDQSLPSGDHFLPATVEKMWISKYVDVFDLLNRKIEDKKKDKEEEREREKLCWCKSDRCWANCLPVFFIYVGTVVFAYLQRALALIQYMDLIYKAYVDFPGHVCLLYDEGFCMWVVLHPNMHCEVPHDALWLRLMTPSSPVLGDRFDNGHLVQRAQAGNSCLTADQVVQLCLSCWEFNA